MLFLVCSLNFWMDFVTLGGNIKYVQVSLTSVIGRYLQQKYFLKMESSNVVRGEKIITQGTKQKQLYPNHRVDFVTVITFALMTEIVWDVFNCFK